jgi:predicted CxxxxCH...CXXCH cytochrome family protein
MDGTVQYDISAAACDLCHGDATGYAPPQDTGGNTSTANRGVGAHRSHLNTAITDAVACATCHTVPDAVLDAGHLDSALPAENTFTGLAASTVFDGTTCSSTYCHGDSLAMGGGSTTTPTWTSVTGAALPCDSCHGDPPVGGHPGSTQCGECHGAIANNTPAVIDTARHIDGGTEYDLVDSPCTAPGCHNHPGPSGWPDTGHHSTHFDEGLWCTDCHYQHAGTANHHDGVDQTGAALVDFAPSAAPAGSYNGTSCSTLPGGPCHTSDTW